MCRKWSLRIFTTLICETLRNFATLQSWHQGPNIQLNHRDHQTKRPQGKRRVRVVCKIIIVLLKKTLCVFSMFSSIPTSLRNPSTPMVQDAIPPLSTSYLSRPAKPRATSRRQPGVRSANGSRCPDARRRAAELPMGQRSHVGVPLPQKIQTTYCSYY